MFIKKGFTLVEIMIVMTIIGILSWALFIWIQPYLWRSRDTKRVSDIQNYLNNMIGSYEKNFDTFPTNKGSGNNILISGYCLSELTTRQDIVVLWREGKFSTLRWSDTSAPPQDPLLQIALPADCTMPGSYFYSRMQYDTDKEIAIIAARLETRTSGNYGTWGDLTNTAKIQDIIFAKKSIIPVISTDQLYIVTALH